MDEVWEFVIIEENPAQGLWQSDGEVESALPLHPKVTPEVRVHGKNFKGACDVSLWKPGSFTCKFNKWDGMVYCWVFQGEHVTKDQTVDTWDMSIVRSWDVKC